uniref:DUF3615 domain-containing protein n=1 Tax=Leersia perrieri TaxID=77586 RepID=A0A0D9V0B8_9ORYZ
MGSVLDSLIKAYEDAEEFVIALKRREERRINLMRPEALLHWDGDRPLPHLDERRRIVQRWIEYEKRKGPRLYDYLRGENDACIARPHVRIALRSYNSHHPGAEFDIVRSLNAHFTSFGDEIWSHVNFLGRRRDCIDAPVLRFFAEILYHGRLAETPVVVSCIILQGYKLNLQQSLQEEPLFIRRIETIQEPVHLTTKTGTDQEPLVQFRSKCAFCTDRDEILHPSDDKFMCGKEGQELRPSSWFYWDERALDHILIRPRCFLDKVSGFFSFLFYVFFIWLANLASAIKLGDKLH